jgi:hypothetical protein
LQAQLLLGLAVYCHITGRELDVVNEERYSGDMDTKPQFSGKIGCKMVLFAILFATQAVARSILDESSDPSFPAWPDAYTVRLS